MMRGIALILMAAFCLLSACSTHPPKNSSGNVDVSLQDGEIIVDRDPVYFDIGTSVITWSVSKGATYQFTENGIVIEEASIEDVDQAVPIRASSPDGEIVDCRTSTDGKHFSCLNRNTRSGTYKYTINLRDAFGKTYSKDPLIVNQPNHAVVEVFYATNRRIDSTLPGRARHTNDRGSLTLGIARVSVPATHKVGEVEIPSWYQLWGRADTSKYMILLDARQLSKDDFLSYAGNALKMYSSRSALVFIHGYWVSFEAAALRTAQMAKDLQFAGIPIMFSWPSQGAPEKYAIDQANAEWSSTDLTALLDALVSDSSLERIFVVAHSMGGAITMGAMKSLFATNPRAREKFKEVILAAPDIDSGVFMREIVPAFKGSPKITLYASSNDKALVLSKTFHGSPRAGDAGTSLVLASGVETLDASALDTDFFGHKYYAENRPLLADLELLIKRGLRPDGRPSLKRIDEPLRHWQFLR